MLNILKIRGFAAYLIIAFLNAFTDLGHKIIIQNTIFKFYDGTTQVVLTALVNACIVLPFVLFFTPTGFLADKFPKERIIQVAAACAVPLTLVITLAYYMGWFELAFAMTLLLGIQAAFYSPAKYGYIKELAGKENIAGANAFVQAVTIISILGGTVAFSALFEAYIAPDAASIHALLQSIAPLGWLLVGFSVLELLFTLRLPHKHDTNTALRFNVRKYVSFGYLRQNLGAVRSSEVIWLSIIGISVFWGVNQVVLAAFPAYLKETLHVQNTTISNGLMGVGGLGIIIGSFIAGKASKDFIETGVIPLGALGITVSLCVLPLVHSLWGLAALFLVYGIMGGLFLIPLNALVQFNAGSDEAGTVLAANNFMQNLLMSSFLVLTAVLTGFLNINSVWMLYGMAVVAGVGSIFALSRLPQAFVRYVVLVMASQRYALRVLGMKNIPSTGGVLLLGNHASWFDWAVLQIACPRPIRYVMLRSIYELPVLKGLLKTFGVIPIAPGKDVEESLVHIRKALQNGDVVAIFPEGRISRNGQLANFKRGFERVVERLESAEPVHIVPFYLRGLWGTAFSYATRHQQQSGLQRGKRSITVAFGERMPPSSTAAQVKQSVTALSIQAWRDYAETLDSIHAAFLKTARRFPLDIALVGADKRRFTSVNFLAQTLAFSQGLKRALSENVPQSKAIGVLLPTSTEGVMTTLALMMNAKTAVMLDYTGSAEDLATGVRHTISNQALSAVITTRSYLETLRQRFPNILSLLSSVKLLYVEDIQKSSGTSRMEISLAQGLWVKFAPVWLLQRQYFTNTGSAKADATLPAVVVFAGKGETLRPVAYTHQHIMLSIRQASEVLNPREDDTVLGVQPLCTSFGLVMSALMPLVSGMTLVCAENADIPTLGKFAARNNATLLFAEPWQLRVFAAAEQLHPLMFASLRLVVTGTNGNTEASEASTQAAFKQKFGVSVYDGFSASDVTPVVSVNVPDAMTPGEWSVQVGTKPGTVGMPLPGCALGIVDEATGEEKPLGEIGRVRIGAPFHASSDATKHDTLWSVTEARGSLDADGFLTLVG
ncbi:MAG: MFS transporter [Candidatus Kapabacteria bacterium]|jgi:acyl-[acyl-carrier-protein]-phospholipid O-acyltransferase/long-chain-fatty-acid--[acyl-carrier-protein] ligase|nr:MFS transporter [Candidatus Kapabacteria bacterium]